MCKDLLKQLLDNKEVSKLLKTIDDILNSEDHQLTMAALGYKAAIRDVLKIKEMVNGRI